jgi:prephenate dehydrogenase
MKIGIVGLGLMGGSLAKGIKRNISDAVVYGLDISKEIIMRAKLLEIIDETLDKKNIGEMDLVFVCAGLEETKQIINDIAPLLKPKTMCFDITGVKKTMVEFLKGKSKEYPQIDFISLHPMAGREYSGLRHSTVNLYENAYILVVPINSSLSSLQKMKNFLKKLKIANIKITSAIEHDKMISYTSQLPHVLSNAYVKNSLAQKSLGFSAGSFRDFTRVAQISSKMWVPLMLENKENVLDAIKDFKENLEKLEKAIETDDAKALKKLLDEGNDAKLSSDKQKWED